jgi:hypothetical protein
METLKRKGNGAIRLSIPAKVAYNADAFKKSIYDLLDELGCPKCFSGVDCYLTTIQDYVLNPKENAIATAQAARLSAQPTRLASQKSLSVGVSQATSFSIDKIDAAINTIFEEIGCLSCCSGNDIFFQNQFDFNF